MKSFHILYTMVCFFLFVALYGCEKSADQSTTGNVINNGQLTNRTVSECANCPNNGDCCCAVELQFPTTGLASLRLCGTSDGAGSCNGVAVGTCPSFSGGGQSISISSGAGNYRKLFCVGAGNTFFIANSSLTDPAEVTLTCQHDLTHPQILTITIPANTTYTYTTSGGCELTLCQ